VNSPANSELPDGSDAEPAPLLLRRARRLLDAVAAITNEVSSGTIVPTFVTGAVADHLTPWKGCYRTTQLLGGDSTFVLSNSGHIASLVNPPANPKARY
jgi:hypothetical protein